MEAYTTRFYKTLENEFDILPERVQNLMPYLLKDNWLLSYATIEGISRVLDGMNKRTKNISKMNLATNELQEYYAEFENEFTLFFDELMTFSKDKLEEINTRL